VVVNAHKSVLVHFARNNRVLCKTETTWINVFICRMFVNEELNIELLEGISQLPAMDMRDYVKKLLATFIF
jgi:hypothetical protein